MIPYGRQSIDADDISAVVDVLRSDWLTTGPKVADFERAFANHVGAKFAVAVSSGTAALHCAMYALGIGPGDEVIVPPMTFTATANCVVYQGGIPVFVDVDPETLLIDAEKAEAAITENTKAIIAVDYTGQPCDYDALRTIAKKHSLALLSDACHALGARYKDKMVGSLADLNVFSFHPVKHITTGEGGMITTDNPAFDQRMRMFRNHGITTDHRLRESKGTWFYEMVDIGYNYRITDFQCALGISQLRKNPHWIAKRQAIASRYDSAFRKIETVRPLEVRANVFHAYHLYVIRLGSEERRLDRGAIFKELRDDGIGVNVHYIPAHLHPYYQSRFGTHRGLCPVAEYAYDSILSLPLFPTMSQGEVEEVIDSLSKVIG